MRLGRQKLDFAIRRHAVLNAAYGIAGTVGRALTRRYPLSLGPTEIDPPPFFIIGAARSGNTLLRALLVGHSHVAIPPESYVLHHIVDRWGQLAFLKWQDLVGVAIGTFASHPEFESWELDLTPVFGRAMALQRRERSLARVLDLVYRHYVDAKEPGARMWGDKTPFNTENWYAIERTFPTARYVHVLRDGRDAVSSAVQADLFSGDVSAACDSWLLRVRRADELRRRISASRFLQVQYEQLVEHTDETIRRVCEFLDISFEEWMLQHERAFDRLGDTTRRAHHANVARPISTDSVGRWRERLTPQQRELVERRLGKEISRLGYG